jgi:hypothetical protein
MDRARSPMDRVRSPMDRARTGAEGWTPGWGLAVRARVSPRGRARVRARLIARPH